MGGQRIFVIEIQSLSEKQKEQHQVISEILRRIHTQFWSNIISAFSENEATFNEFGKMVRDKIEDLQTIRTKTEPNHKSESDEQQPPIFLEGHKRLASGGLALGQKVDDDQDGMTINIQLYFLGRCLIETEQGSVVFCAKSAQLFLEAIDAEIVPLDEFSTSHRSSKIDFV